MRRDMLLAPLLSFLLLGCSGDSAMKTPPQQSVTHAMPQYPSPDTWEYANIRQKDRAKRSFAELKKRHVPVFPGPLFVDDDEEVAVQSPQDVARRVLVLWAVALRAEGMPQVDAHRMIDKQNLWAYVSPQEKVFLENKNPPPDDCQKLVWRLESIWVLLWALGYIEELDWPSEMCDVKQLAGLVREFEDDPKFISGARLRAPQELLNAQDLTMRIHWAIRDAYLHQDATIPVDLDWSGKSELVPVGLSAAVGVVEQRHYVLNWLLKFLETENWDEIDTPT